MRGHSSGVTDPQPLRLHTRAAEGAFAGEAVLEDRAEGMAAFIEKRKPNNKNR